MMRRTWKGFRKMTVERQITLTAEMMRAHRCGPRQKGDINVLEDAERYTVVIDLCGSGGRMRRGEPMDRTPSRLGPPYNYGATQDAHWWGWGCKDFPYYCLHRALNEIMPIEWGGAPLWVTDFDPDHAKPCRCHSTRSPS